MKITCELETGCWERALRAARNTVWKGRIVKEPSDNFKTDLCRCEHSPLRLVRYYIHIDGIKYWTTAHFTRHHIGVEWFQSTLRDDRHNEPFDRDGMGQGEKVMLDGEINAAELIFMARRRLCHMAHAETRAVMAQIIAAVAAVDPIVAKFCVPNCVYRGFCPESNGCGAANSPAFNDIVSKYRH